MGGTSISIHAPLAGCDAPAQDIEISCINFNPRTPCGVRQQEVANALATGVFQSTHPLRGATKIPGSANLCNLISIHAPLAGCDFVAVGGRPKRKISIHAPLAGCDLTCGNIYRPLVHFNPRTPCGVRPVHRSQQRCCRRFQSTHPLRGATFSSPLSMYCATFQSTHPLRGATRCHALPRARLRISIHAPLAGCDTRMPSRSVSNVDFNPRTPCGVRPSNWG